MKQDGKKKVVGVKYYQPRTINYRAKPLAFLGSKTNCQVREMKIPQRTKDVESVV